MSNLGGNSPSADTDKSNNLVGPPGADSTVPGPEGPVSTVPGPPGTNGQVVTVVGGTNTTVDATDPANPIINVTGTSPTTTKGDIIARGTSVDERVAVGTDGQALVADSASSAGVKFADVAAGDPLTTKGDVFGFDTDAARIPVGTNDQVLTADSTAALGVAWKDASGGLISADFNNLPAPAGFHMVGDVALGATHADNAVAPDLIKFDFIFFEATTTTINKISCASDTASNGGSMFVALHPMTARGVIGNQSFVATITVGTGIDTEHEETISTPWVVPRGHYAIIIGNNTAVNLTNIISSISGNSVSDVFGKHVTAKVMFRSDLENEAESRTMFLFKDDYIASPDLSAIGFNDVTNYVASPSVNGDLALSTHVPIVLFRVDSTT